jgi:prepilin-type N-terminal cleavage/methylation domain-containing protein
MALTSRRSLQKIRRVESPVMSLLKAYLRNPRTQRALSLKPGDKGFSLIELVVVVAVLAILAAIAVPSYMGMNEQAADAALETNLKNAYKECAYQLARQANNGGRNYPNFAFPGNDGYYTYKSDAADKSSEAGVHSCYSDADGAATTLTGTKKNATNTVKNGEYSVDVLDGEREYDDGST